MRKGTTTGSAFHSINNQSVALRNEKGNYNGVYGNAKKDSSVALRNEKGNYNLTNFPYLFLWECSTAK